MFHRASDIPALSNGVNGAGFGIDHGGGCGVGQRQNENMVRRNHSVVKNLATGGGGGGGGLGGGIGKGVSFQTPSNAGGGGGGGRRRVLGDISNKKSTNGATTQPFMSSQRKSGQSSLKPKSVSSKTSGSLIPKLSSTTSSTLKLEKQFQNFHLEQKQQKNPSQVNRASFIPSARPTTSFGSKLVKTTASGTTLSSTKTTSSSVPSKVFEFSEPLPDIEFPAGRTWKQQLAYDLKDEDDVASTSTLDRLDDVDNDDDDDNGGRSSKRAMWDDWGESLWELHRKEQENRDEQGEKEVQKQIDRMVEQDKLGLESLFDSTKDLDNTVTLSDVNSIGSAGYQFNGDMESNLLALDDDDWSIPASSECAPMDRSADDSLLLDL
jgi:hypothetical protein